MVRVAPGWPGYQQSEIVSEVASCKWLETNRVVHEHAVVADEVVVQALDLEVVDGTQAGGENHPLDQGRAGRGSRGHPPAQRPGLDPTRSLDPEGVFFGGLQHGHPPTAPLVPDQHLHDRGLVPHESSQHPAE